MKTGKRATLSFFLLSILPLQPVFAQEQEEQTAETLATMIVTAQKRAELVQDIPNSITVLDCQIIEDARIEGMSEIAAYTPGLEFRNVGSRRHSFTFMRGIKNIHNQESAMGYYVDGISYSKSYMFDFPLFDIERIEVLKGSQGTLYGGNSMAGVINVVTADPDNEPHGQLGLSYGSYNKTEVKGHVSAPLIKDKLYINLSGLLEQQDGDYMENDTEADGDDGRHSEGGAGRLKLKFLPTDKLDITWSVDAQSYDEGAFPLRRTSRNALVTKGVFKADESHHYSHDFEGTADTDFWGSNLKVDYELPTASLSSITGYRDYRVDEMVDSDFSPLDMTRLGYVQDDKSFSQEFRLLSPESKTDFQWITGLYFFTSEAENQTTNYFLSGMVNNSSNPFGNDTGNRLIISDGTNDGVAVFGQGTYPFLERFDLTLGLRYEYQEADMNWTQINTPDHSSSVSTSCSSADNSFNTVLPKGSISWHMTDEHMAYATFSGGMRGGGFNKVAPEGKNAYDKETSWLYEVGTKLNFPENRASVMLSAFYIDIDNEQISQFDTSLNSAYNVNAGQSHRMGIEAELHYSPLVGLELSAGFTLLEAEYDSYADAALGTDYAGNQVFNVPEISGNLGMQYRRPLLGQWNFFGRLDLTGMGKRYFDDANTVEDPVYILVNAKTGVEGNHWDMYLWADNLFDEEYVVFENTSKGIAEDGDPVTVGVTLSYRF